MQVCDEVIKDSSGVGAQDIYSDFSVTSHTKQQLVVILAVLLDTPLDASKVRGNTVVFHIIISAGRYCFCQHFFFFACLLVCLSTTLHRKL